MFCTGAGVAWTPTQTGPDSITFTAPSAAADLAPGQLYFVNIALLPGAGVSGGRSPVRGRRLVFPSRPAWLSLAVPCWGSARSGVVATACKEIRHLFSGAFGRRCRFQGCQRAACRFALHSAPSGDCLDPKLNNSKLLVDRARARARRWSRPTEVCRAASQSSPSSPWTLRSRVD